MKVSHYVVLFFSIVFILLLGFPIMSLTGVDSGGVSLHEKIKLPFKVEDNKSVLLLYFGYVGCPKICPASLNEIDNIYKKIDSKHKDRVGVYFVNLKNSGNAQEYVHHFNKDFVGVDLSPVDRMKFMNSLHAYKSDPVVKGGELYHTSYLYLIKRIEESKDEFILENMYYTHPYDAKMVIKDLKKGLK